MGKSGENKYKGTGSKRDLRRAGNRSLRKDVRHSLKQGMYDDLPNEARRAPRERDRDWSDSG